MQNKDNNNLENQIKELRNKLEKYVLDYEGTDKYVGKRLKIIRDELKKKSPLFKVENLAKILNISTPTVNRIENGNKGTNFTVVLKCIRLYDLHGYNPMWILTKENALVDKKHGIAGSLMNPATLEMAIHELKQSLNQITDDHKKSIEIFIDSIKG